MQMRGPPLNGKYSCSLLGLAATLMNVCAPGVTYPAGSQRLPSLWSKLFGVGAVEFWSSVHGVERPLHCLSLWNKERRFTVLASAAGQDGVYFCAASIAGDYGVEA